MKVLVTGSEGFIAKNLIANLRTDRVKNCIVYEFDVYSSENELKEFCKNCDFVFHFAGVNRPNNSDDFNSNYLILQKVLKNLDVYGNYCPVMLSSSIQAELDNPYGKSKLKAEIILSESCKNNDRKALIYRFPNVFGKWCRPNYNSVVSTFCYNISRGIPITVNDSRSVIHLVYIDDVVNEMIAAMLGHENRTDGNFCTVSPVYTTTVGAISDLIYSFKDSRKNLSVADMNDSFKKKLYATYLSYLDEDDFIYDLKMNTDSRGSFTEIIRTKNQGQFSVNISKPGITKGNHWHNTKNEKFLVVSGKAVIRCRKPFEDNIVEYYVSGEKFQVVDIPAGYTHNIENIGETDLITFMWANECFDRENPDTFYLEV